MCFLLLEELSELFWVSLNGFRWGIRHSVALSRHLSPCCRELFGSHRIWFRGGILCRQDRSSGGGWGRALRVRPVAMRGARDCPDTWSRQVPWLGELGRESWEGRHGGCPPRVGRGGKVGGCVEAGRLHRGPRGERGGLLRSRSPTASIHSHRALRLWSPTTIVGSRGLHILCTASGTDRPALCDPLYPPPFFGLLGGFYAKRLAPELIEGRRA